MGAVPTAAWAELMAAMESGAKVAVRGVARARVLAEGAAEGAAVSVGGAAGVVMRRMGMASG